MKNVYNVGTDGFNSYLITDNKTALIDTVPYEKYGVFLDNIKKHTEKIDYIIFNRTTPYAAGCVAELIEEFPGVKIFASVAGLRNLKEIINKPFSEMVAKNSASLELGDFNLEFFMTPNLSWPDTMITYLREQGILFSGNLMCENGEYKYFNRESYIASVDLIKNIKPEHILPGYGLLREKNMPKACGDAFGILYSSHSKNTEKMAYVIKRAAEEFGKKVVMIKASDATDEFFDMCDCFAFGTPTLNHKADEAVLSAVAGMNVVRNQGKNAFVFGSYGWSGEGVDMLLMLLKNLKLKVCKKPFKSIFGLSEQTEDELYSEVINFMGEIKNA